MHDLVYELTRLAARHLEGSRPATGAAGPCPQWPCADEPPIATGLWLTPGREYENQTLPGRSRRPARPAGLLDQRRAAPGRPDPHAGATRAAGSGESVRQAQECLVDSSRQDLCPAPAQL